VESRTGLVYPEDMLRVTFAILLGTVTTTALAEVFKWVDNEGRTQFSDRPRQDAEAAILQPQSDRPNQPGATDEQGLKRLLGSYAAFEILSPEPNQTLRLGEQSLPVNLLMKPPLITGHRLELVLDGVAVSVDGASTTQLNLTGVTYGTHQIQAQIRGAQGAVVARTPAVTFHIRKPLPPGVIQ
jgi:hypothetical protein